MPGVGGGPAQPPGVRQTVQVGGGVGEFGEGGRGRDHSDEEAHGASVARMEINIRKGGAEDLPAVIAMLDGAVEWLVGRGREGQWGSEPWSSRPTTVEKIRRTLIDGEPWIAEYDGVPAGTLTLSRRPTDYIEPADEPEVYILLFVTDRRFKGRGIGAALLAHAVEETLPHCLNGMGGPPSGRGPAPGGLLRGRRRGAGGVLRGPGVHARTPVHGRRVAGAAAGAAHVGPAGPAGFRD
ncbi:hypothetical protein GCM10010357_37910 [Streptomyces luteireticuli]|uniref:N-acetyltransferase domain-containing protein n=1 Tax=Streptomyces luteireticuli TaxID=173858 RepID=A0ABP3IPC7_9ACTN